MNCERNGVEAWLAEYGCWVMTDAYLLGGQLILRTAAQRYHEPMRDGPQVTVTRIEHWFDPTKNWGTMIVLPGQWEGALTPVTRADRVVELQAAANAQLAKLTPNPSDAAINAAIRRVLPDGWNWVDVTTFGGPPQIVLMSYDSPERRS